MLRQRHGIYEIIIVHFFIPLRMSASDPGFVTALEEAKSGFAEGGVPIGACLVSQDGRVLGRGHNMRVQKGSAILHAEISALDNSGRLPASAYAGATMYTTLSPCDMCTGSCVLYKIKRVVIGENTNYVGGEDYLKQRGIDVVVLDNDECKDLMGRFIVQSPAVWYVPSVRTPATILTFVQERGHWRAIAAATRIIAWCIDGPPRRRI
jgi:cytosine/creatinine deaminase